VSETTTIRCAGCGKTYAGADLTLAGGRYHCPACAWSWLSGDPSCVDCCRLLPRRDLLDTTAGLICGACAFRRMSSGW